MTNTIISNVDLNKQSAIHVIRLSGSVKWLIREKLLRFKSQRNFIKSRYVYTALYRNQYGVVDQLNFIFFKNPHSYTGEDMLELYVHGSNTIINSILTDILKTNRVRFAKPGEFTERAFLNGKLDLTQANSILKKYLNKKSSPLNFNRENLGLLSKIFIKLQNLTYDIIFNIESVLEFSTETTIYFNKILYKNKIKLAISILKMFLKKKIKIFNSGFINVGLIGSPNSGKSSLINKLFNKKLSLVSYIGGTTRDNISISLSKFPVHLIDTAGLDKISLCVTDNLLLDYLGIKKTLDTVEQMDLYILLLSFFNIKLMPIFFNLLCKKIFIFNTLVIFNKKDVLISHSLNWYESNKIKYLNYFKVVSKKFFLYKVIIKVLKNKKNLLLDLKVIIFKKINKFLKKRLPDNSFFSFDLSTTNYLKKILKKYVSLTCVGEKFLTNFHEKILFVLYSIIKDLKRLNGEYTNKIALNKIFKNFCIGK